MPRGGKRAGAGRKPKEEAHRRAQEKALTPVAMKPDNVLPPIVRPAYEQIRELETGMGPVDIMLRLARCHFDDFLKENAKRRPKVELKHAYAAMAREAAARAAKFCSPTLASIRHSGSVNQVTWNGEMLMAAMSKLPPQELEALERVFSLIAAAESPAASDPGHHPAAEAPAGG